MRLFHFFCERNSQSTQNRILIMEIVRAEKGRVKAEHVSEQIDCTPAQHPHAAALIVNQGLLYQQLITGRKRFLDGSGMRPCLNTVTTHTNSPATATARATPTFKACALFFSASIGALRHPDPLSDQWFAQPRK